MKILKLYIFIVLFFNLENTVKSFEVKNLASIDNKIITNIDLIQEVKIKELLDNVKIKKNNYSFVLQQMIGDKIKKIETENNKIEVPKEIVNNQYDILKKNKLKDKKISQNLKRAIIFKIEDTYKWNKLISLKYRNKLAINIDEINEIMKTNKIPEDKRDQIVQIERNKKLNTFSKTHFNKVKKKYLVKKY